LLSPVFASANESWKPPGLKLLAIRFPDLLSGDVSGRLLPANRIYMNNCTAIVFDNQSCGIRELPRCLLPRINYLFFFLWRFLRNRFLRLCVAILCLFLFFPQGITKPFLMNE
jgi:hypothetical protein